MLCCDYPSTHSATSAHIRTAIRHWNTCTRGRPQRTTNKKNQDRTSCSATWLPKWKAHATTPDLASQPSCHPSPAPHKQQTAPIRSRQTSRKLGHLLLLWGGMSELDRRLCPASRHLQHRHARELASWNARTRVVGLHTVLPSPHSNHTQRTAVFAVGGRLWSGFREWVFCAVSCLI
jgi:hypothetical protein